MRICTNKPLAPFALIDDRQYSSSRPLAQWHMWSVAQLNGWFAQRANSSVQMRTQTNFLKKNLKFLFLTKKSECMVMCRAQTDLPHRSCNMLSSLWRVPKHTCCVCPAAVVTPVPGHSDCHNCTYTCGPKTTEHILEPNIWVWCHLLGLAEKYLCVQLCTPPSQTTYQMRVWQTWGGYNILDQNF